MQNVENCKNHASVPKLLAGIVTYQAVMGKWLRRMT